MITLNHFLFETFWTIFIMTIVLGGVGIAGIYLAFKKKIIFSKEELFAKKDEYTGIQFLGFGLSLLGVSVWYNFYKGHIFYYSEMWRGFFSTLEWEQLNIRPLDILPIYAIFIFLWIFFRLVFVENFAKKISKKTYSLRFNKLDYLFVVFSLLLIIALIYETNINVIEYRIEVSILLIGVGIIIFGYFFFTKVIFDDKIIEIHGFLKPKQIVLWKDVKNLSYANNKRQTIVIETVDNKKYKISNYLSGLETFISQYKIRNQNNTKKGKK